MGIYFYCGIIFFPILEVVFFYKLKKLRTYSENILYKYNNKMKCFFYYMTFFKEKNFIAQIDL